MVMYMKSKKDELNYAHSNLNKTVSIYFTSHHLLL